LRSFLLLKIIHPSIHPLLSERVKEISKEDEFEHKERNQGCYQSVARLLVAGVGDEVRGSSFFAER